MGKSDVREGGLRRSSVQRAEVRTPDFAGR